jgi:hypothetical protein
MTSFKVAITGIVVIASGAAPLAVQRLDQVKWLEKNEMGQRQAKRLAELSAENKRLSSLVLQTEGASLSNDQFRERLRLRHEIGQLRSALSEISKLRATNQQLLAERTNLEEQPRAAERPDSQTVLAHWPKTQLVLAGYANPTSALETALWAMSRGDPDALAASVTPDAKSKITKETWFKHGPPAEEIASATRKITDSLSPSTGFYVVRENVISQDQAVLDVYFEGEGKTRKFAMKKIGDAWKFDNLGDGTWP